MRRYLSAACLLLLAVPCVAGSVDLPGLAPTGSHLLVQVDDLAAFIPELPAGIVPPAFAPFGGPAAAIPEPDRKFLRGASMLLAVKLPAEPGGAAPPQAVIAFCFPSESSYLEFAKPFTGLPPDRFVLSTVGPYTVIVPRAAAAPPAGADSPHAEPPPASGVALGPKLLILAYGLDLAQHLAGRLASPVAAGEAPALPAPSGPEGVPRLRFRLDPLPFQQAADGALTRWIRHRREEGAREPATAGKNPALSVLNRLPPEQVGQFVRGLGIGQLRCVTGQVTAEDQRLRADVAVGVEPGGSLLNGYLDGIRGRRLEAPGLLPAGTLAVKDFLMDLPLFYRLLAAQVKAAFGPTGEAMVAQLELAAMLKLNLSLTEALFPALGTECGWLTLAPRSAGPAAPMRPVPVFFLVLAAPERFEATVIASAQKLGVQVQKDSSAGLPQWHLTPPGDGAPRWQLHVTQSGRMVYASADRAIIGDLAAAPTAGQPDAASRPLHEELARLPAGCVAFSGGDLAAATAGLDLFQASPAPAGPPANRPAESVPPPGGEFLCQASLTPTGLAIQASFPRQSLAAMLERFVRSIQRMDPPPDSRQTP